MESIVVTGLGIVTPLGYGSHLNWLRLSSSPADSGGGSIRMDSPPGTGGNDVKSTGLAQALGLAQRTVSEALTDAGLWDGRELGVDPERVGCTVSASKPLFSNGAQLGSGLKMHKDGAKRELTPVVHNPDEVNRFVRERFRIRGESRNVVAACATGAYSIALAASWIEQGLCDVVVAGSVEPYPHPLIAAGFHQMGVTSHDGVTRPFDKNRSGFTFGEGAGVVVLESASHAGRRGVRALAQLSGWALGSDSHSAVA